MAGVYLDQKDYDRALPHLLELVRTEDHDPEVASSIAMIYARRDRLSEARYWYTQSLYIDPFNVQAHEALAAVLMRMNDTRAAVTEYTVRRTFGPYAVVAAFPRSGRTHQIRVHLSFMGFPILCDQLYGREKALYATAVRGRHRVAGEKPLLTRHALHAEVLQFAHPRTGRHLRLEAALPTDMARVIGFLRRTRF